MSTSQKPVCCVRGCSLRQKNINEKFFVIPPDTNPRGKSWLEYYPHSFLRQPNVDNYICGRHFTADCFNENGALLHKAIPSVNIDTSFAQDIMMKTFLMKVIFEWIHRNSIDANNTNLVWYKVLEAKDLLGMQLFAKQSVWFSKFINFKFTTDINRKRFGSQPNGFKNIPAIIKDLRQELPSNFVLPCDKEMPCTFGKVTVKEEDEDDVPLSSIQFQIEEPADDPIKIQNRDVVPERSLDTYQEALELLSPLKDYIKRIKNENASLRLAEIETVVKQTLRNDSKPKRKRPQRKRR